jgi:2-methylaconitate cis-trans-isomerase PrpF
MGAGVSSLSKICLINQNKLFDNTPLSHHLDYTFVGMGIEADEVDFAGNCGNMAAAIGPYAFNRRIIPGFTGYHYKQYFQDGTTTLLIRNTNTNVMIRSTFEVKNGEAVLDDSTVIDGVSGLGTRVLLDFLKPGGSKTGKLLPTGNVVDTINGIPVSCVDSANPCVFVRASDININPTILPAQLLAQPEDLRRLEEIRAAAAVMMGLCKEGETPARVIPKIAIVSPPIEQTVLSGEVNSEDSLDLVIRFISDGQPHRATPLTGALCTATAAKISGSVVHQCVRQLPVTADIITIGHSSGRIQVNATMDTEGDVECVSVVRTARRIMEGEVYVTLPSPGEGHLSSAIDTSAKNQSEGTSEEESTAEESDEEESERDIPIL